MGVLSEWNRIGRAFRQQVLYFCQLRQNVWSSLAQRTVSHRGPARPDAATAAILRLIAGGRGATRSSLAAATGLSRAAVSARVDDLVARSVVVEREGASSGGRRPAEVSLRPESAFALIAMLDVDRATVALTELDGTLRAVDHLAIDLTDGPDRVLERVESAFDAALARGGRERDGVLVVAIGVPGAVDAGVVLRPPAMPGWDGFNLVEYFGDRFGVPAIAGPLAHFEALGEHLDQTTDGSLLFVHVGAGISGGFVADGRVLEGAHGAAGDLGHTRLLGFDNVLCICGSFGCLEAVAGGDALARELRLTGVGEAASVGDLVRLAAHGDPRARRAVRQASSHLGAALAGLVGFLNPTRVVIGGPMAALGDDMLSGIRSALYERGAPLSTRSLAIEPSVRGDLAGVAGAGHQAVEVVMAPEGIVRFLQHASG